MASVYEMRGTWPCLSAMAALALVICSGCSQAPATKRHVFDSFEISVPATWTVRVWKQDTMLGTPTPTGKPMVSDARFEGPDGEYLSIHDQDFDVSGIWDCDVLWKVAADAGGNLVIRSEGAMCERPKNAPEDHPCKSGDGKLDALAMLDFKHGFEFAFGNTKRERAEDLKVFRTILPTFRAK